MSELTESGPTLDSLIDRIHELQSNALRVLEVADKARSINHSCVDFLQMLRRYEMPPSDLKRINIRVANKELELTNLTQELRSLK